MPTIQEQIGQRIRAARKEMKLTQAELGQRFNTPFSHAAVCDIEKGRNNFSVARLYEMAAILGKPVEYFYSGIDAEPVVTYRIRDARLIADLFLMWLGTRPEIEYCGEMEEVTICQRVASGESGTFEWRRLIESVNGPAIGAMVDVFIEWCIEEEGRPCTITSR